MQWIYRTYSTQNLWSRAASLCAVLDHMQVIIKLEASVACRVLMSACVTSRTAQ